MSWLRFPFPSRFVTSTTLQRSTIISHVERLLIAQPEEPGLYTRRSIDSVIEWIKLMPTKINIDIQGGVWTRDPKPTYLPPGTNVEFINKVEGKDLMLHFTTGAQCLSDPEFVIPHEGSRIISVSLECKGQKAVAHLWMRDAGEITADWEKVDSGTGNGADMEIDNP